MWQDIVTKWHLTGSGCTTMALCYVPLMLSRNVAACRQVFSTFVTKSRASGTLLDTRWYVQCQWSCCYHCVGTVIEPHRICFNIYSRNTVSVMKEILSINVKEELLYSWELVVTVLYWIHWRSLAFIHVRHADTADDTCWLSHGDTADTADWHMRHCYDNEFISSCSSKVLDWTQVDKEI